MKTTDVPFAALRLQYQLARIPLQLIEAQMAAWMGSEAPPRLFYERWLGGLDATVGNLLGDPKLEERSAALIDGSDALDRAAQLDATATQQQAQADDELKAKRDNAIKDQKGARAPKERQVKEARTAAEQRKRAAAQAAEKRDRRRQAAGRRRGPAQEFGRSRQARRTGQDYGGRADSHRGCRVQAQRCSGNTQRRCRQARTGGPGRAIGRRGEAETPVRAGERCLTTDRDRVSMSRTGFGWSWPRTSSPTSGVSMTSHRPRREDHRTARRDGTRCATSSASERSSLPVCWAAPARRAASPRRRRGRLRDADPSCGSRVARPAAGRRTHHEQRRPGPRRRSHQTRQQRRPHYHRRPGPPCRISYCGPDGADHDDLRLTFCVNEEGEIHNLPVNRLATELWWHYDRRARGSVAVVAHSSSTVSRARAVGLTAGGSVRYMCTTPRGRLQCRTHGSDDQASHVVWRRLICGGFRAARALHLD